MNVIMFASLVDKEIERISGRARSSFSRAHKMIADRLIGDRHEAGSDIESTARLVLSVLKTLEAA